MEVRGALPEDREIADIILFLAVTGQEYRVDTDELRPSRHARLREYKRMKSEAVAKAEAKRLRKMGKQRAGSTS